MRKATRQSWKEDDMLHPIEAATSRAMGVVRAGKLFGVPKCTLHRRLKGKNKRMHGVCKGMESLQTALPRNIELDLVNHIHRKDSLINISVSIVSNLQLRRDWCDNYAGEAKLGDGLEGEATSRLSHFC